ncbi:hypothetical protein LEP1GSC055_1819 [Leptospira borgpetersenii str. Brem 307]|nr:hypothetical protein LEP1GSC055_1819 [Leptospira borgpetersenii str. Brem 307]
MNKNPASIKPREFKNNKKLNRHKFKDPTDHKTWLTIKKKKKKKKNAQSSKLAHIKPKTSWIQNIQI